MTLQVKCDGCQKAVETDDCKLPEGWAALTAKVDISTGGSGYSEETHQRFAHACPACIKRLKMAAPDLTDYIAETIRDDMMLDKPARNAA